MSPTSSSPTPHDVPLDLTRDEAAPDGWSIHRSVLRAALTPERDTDDLTPDVLEAIAAESALGPALRAALTPPGEVHLVDAVSAAIAHEAHDDVGDAVRAALTPSGTVDVADDVLAAIALEHDDTLREALRAEARRVRNLLRRSEAPLPAIRLEDAVDAQMHASEPEGWDADALRRALTPSDEGAVIDMSDAVMAHLMGATGRPVLRVLQGSPPTNATPVAPTARRRTARTLLLWAAAAAAAIAVWRPTLPTPAPDAEATVAAVVIEPARPLAAVNDAHVEELATGAMVTAQVMQFEDGGPTIIMVEEL